MSTLLDTPDSANATEVVALPDLFEVVNGQIVELPPMSAYANLVANELNLSLGIYLKTNSLGRTGVELLYRLPLPEDQTRNRRADVSYVSYERLPRLQPIPTTGNALDVVPDLAAEVVSPTDTAEDLSEKVDEYLRAGVRTVWVVYPLGRKVIGYGPGPRDTRIFLASDDLDAGDILPGFRTPVAALFPPVERPEPAA